MPHAIRRQAKMGESDLENARIGLTESMLTRRYEEVEVVVARMYF
jgi:hypothetical protein